MSDDLYSIRQVARMLRVGDKQVRKWVRSGDLPVIDLGDASRSKHRVSSHDLQKFLDARRVVAKPVVASGRSVKKSPAGKRWL
jgi:excisionase family DNA binding protein